MSPTECLCTMLDKHVGIDQMPENVSMVTSMRSLNSVHSHRFIFNLIVEHIDNKWFVCVMCITCDKLV
jgi:hypothetical protein